MQHHPDRETGDTEEFKAVNKAYAILSDPAARARYDNGEAETPGEISLELRIQQELIKHFIAFAESAEAWMDPIHHIEAGIGKHIGQVKTAVISAKQSIRKLRNFAKRLHGKPGNLVTETLATRIAMMEANVLAGEEQMEFFKLCQKELKTFSFEVEEKKPKQDAHISAFEAFISGTAPQFRSF